MTEQNPTQAPFHNAPKTEFPQSHTVAQGIGAAGGGIAGAALGRSVGGKIGAAVGGVAGAIAGSMAGKYAADLIQETSPSLSLGLGADTKEIELPAHYSWEELQALSKPQGHG